MAELAGRWLDEHMAVRCKPKTAYTYRLKPSPRSNKTTGAQFPSAFRIVIPATQVTKRVHTRAIRLET